jgi:hypothetical protein
MAKVLGPVAAIAASTAWPAGLHVKPAIVPVQGASRAVKVPHPDGVAVLIEDATATGA